MKNKLSSNRYLFLNCLTLKSNLNESFYVINSNPVLSPIDKDLLCKSLFFEADV